MIKNTEKFYKGGFVMSILLCGGVLFASGCSTGNKQTNKRGRSSVEWARDKVERSHNPQAEEAEEKAEDTNSTSSSASGVEVAKGNEHKSKEAISSSSIDETETEKVVEEESVELEGARGLNHQPETANEYSNLLAIVPYFNK